MPQKKKPTLPPRPPIHCDPLAHDPSMHRIDTLVDAFGRVTHPLDLLAVNGTMLLAGAGQMLAGQAVILGGCFEPTPFEPVTCGLGLTAGGASIAAGGTSLYFAADFFKKHTLPAIKDWGCHE